MVTSDNFYVFGGGVRICVCVHSWLFYWTTLPGNYPVAHQ